MSIFILGNFCEEGFSKYYYYRNFKYQSCDSTAEVSILDKNTSVSQEFIAKGNGLSNISLYLLETPNQDVLLTVSDVKGKEVGSANINFLDYKAKEWNEIALNCTGLEIDEEYVINISSSQALSSVCFGDNNCIEVFGNCTVDEECIEGTVAIGFNFIDKSITIGNALEMFCVIFFSLIIIGALSYSIWNIELLYGKFNESETKKGLWYAVYFAISFVLMYNPLEKIRNEVIEFKRVIGIGINANVDVSRRTSNFNTWFIMFAITLCLLYLLFNHLLSKEQEDENKKLIAFMDGAIVLSNCLLVLKCITFFNNKEVYNSTFLFLSNIVLIVLLSALAYVVMDLKKNVDADIYAKMLIIGVAVSYPLSILLRYEGDMRKTVSGVLALVYMCIVVFFADFVKEQFRWTYLNLL
jgi:hypothetical protein